MKYTVHDKNYNFKYAFDTKTGFYIRTGILDEKGKDTGVDPFMAWFPHLIDVGIMGHCIHGKTGLCKAAGIQCYQSGFSINHPNMAVEDFEQIAKECSGLTNQLALGGRGDPNQHEHFKEILEICEKYNLVPNYTTSGFQMTQEQVELSKKYCGAVAVSWYRSPYTLDAINCLVNNGVKTNVHYVLSKNTIEEAVVRLENADFPKHINAVIFLLHKPAGQGSAENMIGMDNPFLPRFVESINNGTHPFKIGFDSCSVPLLINFCGNINRNSLDTCEGARFSCYISSDMMMSPCSFDREEKYAVSIKDRIIESVWNSAEFSKFRKSLQSSCPNCKERDNCMGGCPLMPQITLCESGNKIQTQAY